MREIKFRIWTGRGFKTIPEELHGKRCAHSPCMYSEHNGYSVFGFSQRENYILQQFTGLKDKNGVDVYEGDIVSSAQNKCVNNVRQYKYHEVVFERSKFSYKDSDCSFWLDIKDGYGEVIGNIFENKELIKNV